MYGRTPASYAMRIAGGNVGSLNAHHVQLWLMPLTVFDVKGIPGHRREPIEAAVVAGGKNARLSYEAWIAADPFQGGFRLLITGPHGFERAVSFSIDDGPAVITDRVREALEE